MDNSTFHSGQDRASRVGLDDRPRRWRRRLLFPIITLLVAALLWIRTDRLASRKHAEVEAFARALIAEAAPPRPSRAGIAGTEPVIAALAREQLADIAAGTPPPSLSVLRGDVPGAAGGGTATHRIEVAGADGRRLLLRVVHPGDPSRLTIVGIELGRSQSGPEAGTSPSPPPCPTGGRAPAEADSTIEEGAG